MNSIHPSKGDPSKGVSRRLLLTGGVAAGSAGLLAATGAQAQVKVPKSAVRFSSAATIAGHTCGGCKSFQAPSACLFVEGKTSPDCSCWIWRGKTA
ncbi:hypothetical protein M2323_001042 [Rhodoblastus acidophilus]|uniref:high potential iron sulfur protein n=1 Tax=Rhodoblastus acidophilus TaxID=1074 RepID=UPI00222498A6|nr:high potential iron sulfur protein [Rhodoblastus acidophilus]MCW2283273.1 hypothetical protein [Rhodoblastus acidophilus]MCW2332133.1 hypothetical protein [Rhodoblastus acidophilus]